MINLFRKEDPQLDAAIARIYDKLMDSQATTDDIKEATARLTELNALKNQGLDPNKLVIALANIYIGMRVLRFEEAGVVTTKLWSFMQKI
jgi:hypothetical protein